MSSIVIISSKNEITHSPTKKEGKPLKNAHLILLISLYCVINSQISDFYDVAKVALIAPVPSSEPLKLNFQNPFVSQNHAISAPTLV